ncbi:MAG: LemA family protein [Patescibacteria group bacterium]|jgi:LemA protein
MSIAVWIIIIIVAIILIALIAGYNKLVTLKVRSEEAWSDIDVQLKRRYDLIPNLVETVKGYEKHEKEVFENVTKARADALKAGNLTEKGKAENQISEALKSIFAIAENYPQLKANENFGKLQDELTDTEDKIQAARRFYNGNVRELNIAIQSFPSNIIASMFGFKSKELFEVENEAEKQPAKVNFS